MKKHFHFLAAVAALMTCACSVEPVDVVDVQPEEEGEFTVLTAGFAGAEDETRTVRQADGKVFWSIRDEIVVIRGKRRVKFTSTNSSPAAVAAFRGSLPSGTDSFWAIHPYNSSASFDGTYLATELPDKQKSNPGTFSDDQFISVATFASESEELSFYHVLGGLKFTLTEPGVSKVTLIANGGEPLAGVIGIQDRKGRPAITAFGDTQSQIELSPSSGTFQVGEAYYFTTVPGTLEKGFTLLFEKEDGSSAYRSTSKPVTFEPARFKAMTDVDKGLVYEKDFFTYSPSSVSLSKSGGSFTIRVHSSKDFHFEAASDWIWETGHTGNPLMEASYTFRASRNDGEAREGFLLLCNDTNCFPIQVSQEAGSEDDWKSSGFSHRSLGMRFTATWCGYCPIMSETFHMAKEKLGDVFQYACFYSPSQGGNYGFSAISTLENQYAVDGFPTGIVDGRVLIGNYGSDYASELIVQAVRETEANYPTATGIGLRSSLDGETVSVDVDVYAHIADNYKLTVLLLENNIIGYQADYTYGNHSDFVHDKVVRASLTDVSGQAFAAGEFDRQSFSLSVPVFDEYDPDNLEILVYVQRPFGSQPVIQSGRYGDWYVDNCVSLPVGKAAIPDLK